MKIKIIYAFLVLFIGLNFAFQSTDNETPKTSLLWKIEGKDLKNPAYLFGTMHLIQKEYFYFPSSLEKIIKKSEVVLTEIALDKLGNQQETMKFLYLKEGSLLDYFSEKQQDTLLSWAKNTLKMDKNGFVGAFGKMKPFVIVQTIVQMNFFGKTESYEMKIQEIASKNKLKFQGLESIAKQIAFFDDLSKEKQAEMVLESIREEKKNVQSLIQIQGIYQRQQLDSLYYLIESEGGVISQEQNSFLDNRNIAWLPKIISTMNTNKTFIAVGAGHLAGKQGLIELLRKEGYTVTPVKI